MPQGKKDSLYISLKPKKSFHVHFEDIPIWVFATEMINTVPSFIKDPQATGSRSQK